MFSILIVEDDPATNSALQNRLERVLGGSRVDAVESVEDAIQQLETVQQRQEPYDAVVLDVNLPRAIGAQAEMDQTLCGVIRTLMPRETIIAHVSAYLDDPKVIAHMRAQHDEQVDRAFRLSKRDSEWTRVLESKLKTFLYGAQISQQMDQLFGKEDVPSSVHRNRAGRVQTGDDRSVTHKLSGLSRAIETYWNDLDPLLKARIERTFEVTTQDDKTIVSLF